MNTVSKSGDVDTLNQLLPPKITRNEKNFFPLMFLVVLDIFIYLFGFKKTSKQTKIIIFYCQALGNHSFIVLFLLLLEMNNLNFKSFKNYILKNTWIDFAASGGHFEILKWACDNGCP